MSEEKRRHRLIELGDANEMARAAVTSAAAAAPTAAAAAEAPPRASVSACFMHAIFHHDHSEAEAEEDADLPAYDHAAVPFLQCIIVTASSRIPHPPPPPPFPTL
jgi:hypothetical protein